MDPCSASSSSSSSSQSAVVSTETAAPTHPVATTRVQSHSSDHKSGEVATADQETYMLHPPHPCLSQPAAAPSGFSPPKPVELSSPAAANGDQASAPYSFADMTTCSPANPLSLYPSLPCRKPFTCNPKPAFPEVDMGEVDPASLPCTLVKFTQGSNYQKYCKLPVGDRKKLEEAWGIFHSLSEASRRVCLDGVFGMCSWPQLTYTSGVLKPLMRVDFIAELPSEIAWKIMSHLDAVSLCQASLVSKKWKVLAENDLIWRRMCETHTEQKCRNCGWGLPRLEPEYSGHQNKRQKINYKAVYGERLTVARNWKKGKYQLKQLKGHTDGVMCIQMNATLIATGSFDRDIRIWDAATGECTAVLQGHTRCVRSLQFDGEKLISGSMDHTIKIWCMKNGKCLRTLTGHSGGVLSLNYDNKRLVSGSVDCDIKVWDIHKGECYTLTGHTDWVNSVVINDKDFLLSGSDDMTIRLWDLRSRQCLKVFEGHVGQVHCLQALGERFISGSLDSTIKIWNITTGECIKTLFGHMEGVWCVKFDKLRIVSGAHDKTVKIWDAYNGACLQTLTEHTGVVNCLQLNDSRIVTGSEDGIVRIFDFGRH